MKWYKFSFEKEPYRIYEVGTSPAGLILKVPPRLRQFIGRNVDFLKKLGKAIELKEGDKS
jgi:hypothetical protein